MASVLEAATVAYESHRNALENVYAQLTQWQQPPGEGGIHVGPAEVKELLHDILDVLEQCALRVPTPTQPPQMPPVDAPQTVPAASPESPSRRVGEEARDASLRAQPAERALSDAVATSRATQPGTSARRAPAAVTSPRPTVGNTMVDPGAGCVPSEATMTASARRQERPVSPSPKPKESPSTEASPIAPQPQPEQQPTPLSTPGTAAAPATFTATTATLPVADRSQRRAAHVPRRNQTGVPLTPWPLLDGAVGQAVSAKDASRSVPSQGANATSPSARARAMANFRELPAPQYRTYKEAGRPLLPSPERRAAAAELERRVQREEAAKKEGALDSARDVDLQRVGEAPHGDAPAPTVYCHASLEPPQHPSTMPSTAERPPLETAPRSRSGVHRSEGLADVLRRRTSSELAESPCGGSRESSPFAPVNPGASGEKKNDGASNAAEDVAAPRSPRGASAGGTPPALYPVPAAEDPIGSGHGTTSTAASSTAGANVTAEAPRKAPPSTASTPSASSAARPLRAVPAYLLPSRRGEPATPPGMPFKHVHHDDVVETPRATPQRYSDDTGLRSESRASTSISLSSQQQLLLQSGQRRPLRTSTPCRTNPKALDSHQVEDAVFHRRLSMSTSSSPLQVRADPPEVLQYMQKEDAKLELRRDQELEEVHRGPLHVSGSGDASPLLLKAQQGVGDGGALTVKSNGAVAVRATPPPLKPTAVEAQLTAERAVLLAQLEKMQMEVSIAVTRNREWGNERRYTQINARMARVIQDLDRVETELRVVRKMDSKARSQVEERRTTAA